LEGENELIPWKRRNMLPKRHVTDTPSRPRGASRKKKPGAR
jgi:hypothetical protein